jgi:hypothetical protein
MIRSRLAPAGEHIIEPMLALAGCSLLQPIIVTGSNGIELAFRAQPPRLRAGRCRRQIAADRSGNTMIALVDWRQRTLRALETTLDWLLDFLSPAGVLVVWLDSYRPAVREELCYALERRGLAVKAATIQEYGCALSARRREMPPLSKAA